MVLVRGFLIMLRVSSLLGLGILAVALAVGVGTTGETKKDKDKDKAKGMLPAGWKARKPFRRTKGQSLQDPG